jgi:hypothetical protein
VHHNCRYGKQKRLKSIQVNRVEMLADKIQGLLKQVNPSDGFVLFKHKRHHPL